MASTVRIGQETKHRLHRLQQAWLRVRGEPPTQQDLLERCLAFLENHQDDFLAEAAWRPMSEGEIAQFEKRIQVRSGDKGQYDIDEVVYGEDEA